MRMILPWNFTRDQKVIALIEFMRTSLLMGDVSIVSVTLFENCVSFSQHLLSVLPQKRGIIPNIPHKCLCHCHARLAARNYRPILTISHFVIYGLGQFGHSPSPQFMIVYLILCLRIKILIRYSLKVVIINNYTSR